MSQPPLFEQIEQLRAAEARDELFYVAVNIVREHGRGSVNLLQRKLRIGYTRAARLVEQLHEAGVLGPDLGAGRGREYTGDDGPAAPRTVDTDAFSRVWDDAPADATLLDAGFDVEDTTDNDDEGSGRAWDEDVPWDEDDTSLPPASPAPSTIPPTGTRPAAPPTVWY
jgi:S-DNA-T family DNA segregation ATPase FtsK/SpoIIIE